MHSCEQHSFSASPPKSCQQIHGEERTLEPRQSQWSTLFHQSDNEHCRVAESEVSSQNRWTGTAVFVEVVRSPRHPGYCQRSLLWGIYFLLMVVVSIGPLETDQLSRSGWEGSRCHPCRYFRRTTGWRCLVSRDLLTQESNPSTTLWTYVQEKKMGLESHLQTNKQKRSVVTGDELACKKQFAARKR